MRRFLILLPLLAALLLAAAPGLHPALAADADNANAPLFSYPNNSTTTCASGGIANGTDAGFVNFHRVGNVVSFNVHLQGVQPNATFFVALACVNFVGTITTNSNGVGNGTFQQAVDPAQTQFFVDIYNLTSPGYLASALVTLQ